MGSVCTSAKVNTATGEDNDEVSFCLIVWKTFKMLFQEDNTKKKAQATTSKETVTNHDDETTSTLRLLLLGAAESGKTTLLSQIRLLYNNKFSEAELIHRKAFIYNNIMNSMKAVIKYADDHDFQLSSDNQVRSLFNLLIWKSHYIF